MDTKSNFKHPYDTPLKTSFRFLAEIFEWTAAAWISWPISPLLSLGVLIVLIGLPTLFSTPNDKPHTIVAVPGIVRLLIELFIHVVGLVTAWLVWPTRVAIIVTVIAILALILGIPRAIWLIRGAQN